MGGPQKARGKPHTVDEWETFKEAILSLYRKEGRTLDEVAQIMATKHGFHANARQYKYRIHLWKAQKSRQPPANAADAPVSGDTLVITEPSDGTDPAHAAAASSSSPNGSELSLFRPLQARGQLRSMDLVAVAILAAFQPLQSHLVLARAAESGTRPHLAEPPGTIQTASWTLGEFYLRGQTLSTLMSLPSRPGSPGRVRQVALLNAEIQHFIDRVIDDVNPNPLNITCMLQLCCRFWQDNQLPVLRILLRYIGQRAAVRTPGHHLRLLCDALLDSLDVLPLLALFTARRAVDASTSFLSPHHPQTLSAYRGLLTALLNLGDVAGALDVCNQCLDSETETERESVQATTMWRTEAILRVTRCELAMNRIDDAEAHTREFAGSIQAINEVGKAPWSFWYWYLHCRGELLRLQGDLAAAETLLQEALAVAQNNCKLFNWWYVIYAKRHLQFARNAGDSRTPFSLLTY